MTKLYRRRYIPDEKLLLKDDIIVTIDSEKVVTKWNVLSPVHPFTHGVSCYFIKEGFKVSKFLDSNDELVYWYCDIIETDYDAEDDSYTFNDLLIDVIIEKDGFVKVVDLDEIAVALEKKILDEKTVIKAVNRASKLLDIIYGGKFDEYKNIVERV
ncbi:MAG: DUF402 domain-containing protein [Firmicutes bacterium]|nr:DUF402 domain-containing protein [Bacillota bacterium]